MNHLKLKHVNNKKGATLIEVLISVALLGIIITVFVQILNNTIVLRSKSDLQAEASAIAMSQIETLKQVDIKPTSLTPTTQNIDGFEVVTTLTDVTDSITLNKTTLPQASTTAFKDSELIISLGKNINIIQPSHASKSISLTGLENNKLYLSIRAVSETDKQVEYTLNFTNTLGKQTVNLGRFEELSKERYFKIICESELTSSIILEVDDNTKEPLQFGLFEDFSHLLVIKPTGENTTLTVSQNLSEAGDPSTLGQHYYEILVTVSKNRQEYVRLLSTWAVKGD